MVMEFVCTGCGATDTKPLECACGNTGAGHCDECGTPDEPTEVAPGIYICPGCVDMHRRRMGAAA